MDFKKYFLIIALFASLFAGVVEAAPRMTMTEPSIEPAPLDTVENNGEGNITFLIGELNDEDVAGNNRFTVSVNMGKVDLKNADLSLVTITDARNAYADVANKFDITYLADYKMVVVKQKESETLPGGMRYSITIPVVVTENTPVTNPNNGFLANMSSEGDADADGDVDQYTYTKDQTAPASPELLIIDNTDVNETDPTTVVTNNTTPLISGVCEVDALVTIQIDGEPIEPTVNCDENGTFAITPTIPIEEGEHNVTSTQTDVAGNTSPRSPVDYLVVDQTAPTAPTVEITEDANNDGKIDNIEANGDLDVTITLPADTQVGDILAITDANGTEIDSLPVTQDMIDNGYPIIVIPLEIGETVTVNATLTDEAGNTSPEDTDSAERVDTRPVPPTITTVDGNSSNPVVTSNEKPEINGTCETGDTVTVQIDGTDIAPKDVECTDGTYSIIPEDPITEGEHNVTATQTNPDTNETSPATDPVELVVDTTAPEPLTIETVDGQTDMPARTTDTTPTISGKCAVDDNGEVVVSIDEGDVVLTATCSAEGMYSVTPETALDAGEHSIEATEVDDAGNIAVASAAVLIVNPADYKPTLLVYNGIVYGAGSHAFSFTTKILSVLPDGTYDDSTPIVIKIQKNDALTLIYDSDASSFIGQSVDNALWDFDDSDPFEYIFTFRGEGSQIAGSIFGVSGTLTVEEGDIGKFFLEATIKSTTGGDTNTDNNSDRETLQKRL